MLYAVCILASLFFGFILGVQVAMRVYERRLIMHGLDHLAERIKNSMEKK
jgi:hypothetical protein